MDKPPDPSQLSEREQESLWNMSAGAWWKWADMAKKLKSAAEVLQVHIQQQIEQWQATRELQENSPEYIERDVNLVGALDLIPISLMLYGFALENQIKAHMVTSLLPCLTTAHKLPWAGHPKGHDLVVLFVDVARISVNVDEVRLLGELTRLTQWAGRYPSPARVTKMPTDLTGALSALGGLDWVEAFVMADALFARISF